MTDAQKEKIARLVAEKVWGWSDLNDDSDWHCHAEGRHWFGHHLYGEVFSWPGFGRTVEAMDADGWYEFEWCQRFGGFRFYHPEDSIQTPEQNFRDIGDPPDITLACHLAALDALGIDWKEEIDHA